MKRIILPVLFILLVLTARTQSSSIVVFTQESQRFSVILNGILQNPDPQTNIKITELQAPSYKLKIIFESQGIPDINKSIYLQPNTGYTYEVKKNKKGEWVLGFVNQYETGNHVPEPQGQVVFVYTTVPAQHVTTTTQTTTISNGGITTTTTTSETTDGIVQEVHDDNVYMMPGYDGPYGCHRPMKEREFESAKSSIQAKDFESSKLTIARQIASSNCLFSSQVKEIMELFSFESSRLDFAKFAYAHTLDQGNYFKVNDAFGFETSVDELNQFISSEIAR